MKERIKALMLILGITEAHATALLAGVQDVAGAEEPKDLTNEQVRDAAMAKLKKSLAADPTFTDPIRNAYAGKLLDILTKKLRKAFPDLSDDEIDALPEENRYDAMVALAGEKGTARKGDETDEQRAEKLRDLNLQIKTLKADLKKAREEEIPAAQAAGEEERKGVRLERALERELTKKDKERDGLVVDSEFATPSVKSKLLARYDVEVQEDGSVKLFKKGSKDPDFDAQHNEITFSQAVKTIGMEAKLFVLNNGKAGKKEKGDKAERGDSDGDEGGGRNGNIRELPGAARARAHAEKMKKKVAAGDDDDDDGDGDEGDEK